MHQNDVIQFGGKIQVLMSTYNGELYVETQLLSILNQRGCNVDVLIRDDGSTDGTVDIINRLAGQHDNITVILGPNLGVVGSFFELMYRSDSTASYYAFADQDDYWEEDKLISAITLLEGGRGGPLLYCSNLKVADVKLDLIGFLKRNNVGPRLENAVIENIATGCTIVVNKPLIDLVKNHAVDVNKITMHDKCLYILANLFGNVIFDDNSYILYRQHSNNVIGLNNRWALRAKLVKEGLSKDVAMAKEIFAVYGHLIDVSSRAFLLEFVRKKNFLLKLLFLLRHKVRRQTIKQTVFFYLVYLFKQ